MEELAKIFNSEEIDILKNLESQGHPKPEYTNCRGHNIIPGFSAETIEYAKDKWNAREGDVILASYPKTGAHWMGQIVQRIMFQEDDLYKLVESLPLHLKILDLGAGDPGTKFSLIDKLPPPRRAFACHLPAELLDVEKIKKANAKVLYVLRNPKDQIVSWYKFAPSIPLGQTEPIKQMVHSGWDKFLEHTLACDFPMNTRPGEWYPDNILSWYAHKDDKTVMFVYYEDLKQDFSREIKRIAKFLDTPITDEKVEEIVTACTFGNMKKTISDDTMAGKALNVNMRKGEVGGWKEYFTVSQSERVDTIMKEKLSGTDIKFKYEL